MSLSALLHSLIAVNRAHPTARKLLVATDVNLGRELLATLARATGGWIGWEATNLRGIAEDLSFVPLSQTKRRAASDIEIAALVNRALDASIANRRVSARFATLERSLGFQRALRDALLALRTGAVSTEEVGTAIDAGSPAFDLPPVMEEYERLLELTGVADPAAIFHAALDAFDAEAPFVLNCEVVLIPSLVTRGLPGRLLQRLLANGARVLESDRLFAKGEPPSLIVHVVRAAETTPQIANGASATRSSSLAWLGASTFPAPDDPLLDPSAVTTDFFAASTPSEELREVCRRITAESLRWDQVEIVTTDVDTYGIALDALCQQLRVGATMLHGIPFSRTRLGRALERWLAWLENGLPADVLREALEAGELAEPEAVFPSTALAHELRRMKIGWGRDRYETALRSLRNGGRFSDTTPGEDESQEQFESRRDSHLRRSNALASLLARLLQATPAVPERGSERAVRGSCSLLARAALRWFALVPKHGPAEEHTAIRLETRLEQLAAIEDPEVPFASALAAFRDSLADLRAWPLVTSDRKPWSAAGGMLHFTDIAHAGATGRERVFVVGLDAGRAQGTGRQDPLLPDSACLAIGTGAVASSTERRDENGYTLAHALASLRGRVTLSYATSNSIDGRESSPAAVLLQAWRIAKNDATLSYQDLRTELRPAIAAVPRRGADGQLTDIALLDARDIWLDALTDGELLLDGNTVVRSSFQMLDGGFRAIDLSRDTVLNAYHGLIPHASDALDPLGEHGAEISPSSLEKLSQCPLSWFYKYGLKLYLPDDPEYDPDAWLDERERGSLLHEVFETFGREYQEHQGDIAGDGAAARMLEIVNQVLDRWRELVPPPGQLVFSQEAEEIRTAARIFLTMERDRAAKGDGGSWLHFEFKFGGGATVGLFALPDGTALRVKGFADRVDELEDNTLRVVDYKTGRASRYERNSKGGAFAGGRQLQPALYVAALAGILGATVSRFEYRFPTERGGSEIVAYEAAELDVVHQLVLDLLQSVKEGAFIPTTDDKDCSYCDHQAICRVTRSNYKNSSPRAEWAKEHGPTLAVYRSMIARRAQGIPS